MLGTTQVWGKNACQPGMGRPYLIKVSNDLIEEAQTLDTHVVAIQLDVEVIKVRDGGEHDPHL